MLVQALLCICSGPCRVAPLPPPSVLSLLLPSELTHHLSLQPAPPVRCLPLILWHFLSTQSSAWHMAGVGQLCRGKTQGYTDSQGG